MQPFVVAVTPQHHVVINNARSKNCTKEFHREETPRNARVGKICGNCYYSFQLLFMERLLSRVQITISYVLLFMQFIIHALEIFRRSTIYI